METTHSRPRHILLVEDNQADVRMVQEMLKEIDLLAHLTIVHDGEDALAFLRQEEPYLNAPRPDCILLDLHLPRRDGFTVLRDLQDDPRLRGIPVVACVSSDLAKEQLKAFDLPADCIFVKGYDPEELKRVLTRCPAVTHTQG
jgi:chemotaxis family two-component system response regulator Rcp1